MHLPDGVLSGNLTAAGYALSALSTYIYSITQKAKLSSDLVPRISLVTAVFFVASLIHIPVGLTSVHFSLVGLTGILLGPYSLFAVGIGLLFQMIMFNHGGYASLGVNFLIFGFAALSGYYIFLLRQKVSSNSSIKIIVPLGFLAGALPVAIKIVIASAFLYAAGYPLAAGITLLVFHIPVMLGEGVLTGSLVVSLLKLKKGYIYGE